MTGWRSEEEEQQSRGDASGRCSVAAGEAGSLLPLRPAGDPEQDCAEPGIGDSARHRSERRRGVDRRGAEPEMLALAERRPQELHRRVDLRLGDAERSTRLATGLAFVARSAGIVRRFGKDGDWHRLGTRRGGPCYFEGDYRRRKPGSTAGGTALAVDGELALLTAGPNGATIGPMIAFASRAARAADRESLKHTVHPGVTP